MRWRPSDRRTRRPIRQALDGGSYNAEMQLCTLDVLIDGEDDLRKLPLSMRKTNLEMAVGSTARGAIVDAFDCSGKPSGPSLNRSATIDNGGKRS
jgi:bifunctional non-homologous end joining protein LigD